MLDINFLRGAFALSEESPSFLVWLPRTDISAYTNSLRAGKPALATVGGEGIYCGTINNTMYAAARVAYALAEDRWPMGHIVHLDGDLLNNAPANMCEALEESMLAGPVLHSDSPYGIEGVRWSLQRKRWQVRQYVGGKLLYGGAFIDLAGAIAAAKALKTEPAPPTLKHISTASERASGIINKREAKAFYFEPDTGLYRADLPLGGGRYEIIGHYQTKELAIAAVNAALSARRA